MPYSLTEAMKRGELWVPCDKCEVNYPASRLDLKAVCPLCGGKDRCPFCKTLIETRHSSVKGTVLECPCCDSRWDNQADYEAERKLVRELKAMDKVHWRALYAERIRLKKSSEQAKKLGEEIHKAAEAFTRVKKTEKFLKERLKPFVKEVMSQLKDQGTKTGRLDSSKPNVSAPPRAGVDISKIRDDDLVREEKDGTFTCWRDGQLVGEITHFDSANGAAETCETWLKNRALKDRSITRLLYHLSTHYCRRTLSDHGKLYSIYAVTTDKGVRYNFTHKLPRDQMQKFDPADHPMLIWSADIWSSAAAKKLCDYGSTHQITVEKMIELHTRAWKLVDTRSANAGYTDREPGKPIKSWIKEGFEQLMYRAQQSAFRPEETRPGVDI